MERTEDAAFGPVDRIGQLTMRNLDIADSRAKLELYAAQGIVGGATAELVGGLEPAIVDGDRPRRRARRRAGSAGPRGHGVRHRLTHHADQRGSLVTEFGDEIPR